MSSRLTRPRVVMRRAACGSPRRTPHKRGRALIMPKRRDLVFQQRNGHGMATQVAVDCELQARLWLKGHGTVIMFPTKRCEAPPRPTPLCI